MLLAVFNPRSLQSCQKSCWRSSPLWKVGAFRLRHPLYSSPFVPATLDRRPRRQDIGCRASRSCAELMRFIRFSFPRWYILFTFFFLRFIFSVFIFLHACWLAQTCPQSHVAANKFPKDIVTLSLSLSLSETSTTKRIRKMS